MTSSSPKKIKKACWKSKVVKNKIIPKVNQVQKMIPLPRSRRSWCQYLKWWRIRYPRSKSSYYCIIYTSSNILNWWTRGSSCRPSNCCRRNWYPEVLSAKTNRICSNWLAWLWTNQWRIILCSNQLLNQIKSIPPIKMIRSIWRSKMKKICRSTRHRINRRLRPKILQPSS